MVGALCRSDWKMDACTGHKPNAWTFYSMNAYIALIFGLRFFFCYSTATSSSEESNIDVDQWLNLSQHSPTTSPSGSNSDRMVTSSQQLVTGCDQASNQPQAVTEKVVGNHVSQARTIIAEDVAHIKAQGSYINGETPSLTNLKHKSERGGNTGSKKRSEEAKRRYALQRRIDRQRNKELGIGLTPSQKEAIRVQKERYWKQIKSDPEKHARLNKLRVASRIKRESMIKADPKLDEIRKRKKRDRTRAYRARLKAEGQQEQDGKRDATVRNNEHYRVLNSPYTHIHDHFALPEMRLLSNLHDHFALPENKLSSNIHDQAVTHSPFM
ncbi:uncharacterized protein FA14DRAFT_184450 [Meira miltonrushii]|uniref:Uncharacterized protein n=1 Tax=Meira miltonrushii TaxID=1280837 RepID=A0A316VC69_9BASI|nr:uncharacterized protein FA14DRAFT_184450 [Meira miltonrushii]PWN35126.1 hypothetical protein FA14DRAFT_184450 [Meira miltonrushii]